MRESSVEVASRVVFARIGVDMFKRSPVWGHGMNAFFFRTPEFGAKYGFLVPKVPHNIAVKLASEAGLIGLGALAWIIWAVFRCGRRLWRSASPAAVWRTELVGRTKNLRTFDSRIVTESARPMLI